MSIWRFDYAPHAEFVAPALAKGQLWRLLIGIILVAAFFLALSQMLVNTVMSLTGDSGLSLADPDAPMGQTPGEALLILVQLGLLGVSAGLVCVVAHNRAPSTLIGQKGRALGQFAAVTAMLVLIVLALLILPPYGFDDPMQRNMGLGVWLLLLPFGLIAVFIQVSAE
ncbi:MAG: CPBP family intramembrane glutamate endopeptidase, partial [Pseudomonadota bacterium]